MNTSNVIHAAMVMYICRVVHIRHVVNTLCKYLMEYMRHVIHTSCKYLMEYIRHVIHTSYAGFVPNSTVRNSIFRLSYKSSQKSSSAVFYFQIRLIVSQKLIKFNGQKEKIDANQRNNIALISPVFLWIFASYIGQQVKVC